ncbi:MAG TPA: hypothetical protein V6D11_16965 [Waterburya sp.]
MADSDSHPRLRESLFILSTLVIEKKTTPGEGYAPVTLYRTSKESDARGTDGGYDNAD